MATLKTVIDELIHHYQFIVIEASLVLLAVLLALLIGGARRSRRRLEVSFRHFAQRRLLAVIFVGVLTLVVRVALLPVIPIPVPGTHDEFSYLLAADTFASGRLTNPTHPLWMHFESFHILQQPTYNSMYPIASSVMMTLGKVVFGHPWWGVWLSAGIFCAALCWMLQGWLPPQWALLGGLIGVIRIGLFSYWMNSYMGGALAGLGGVLVLGALPRIMKRPRVVHAIVMGIGVIALANSRPNEGFFTVAGAMLALLIWFLKKRPAWRVLLPRFIAPFGLMLVLMCIAMGFYFWRVTGSPVRMPYQVDRQTYATAPLFFFSKVGAEPHYNHPVMRDFYVNWEQALYEKTLSLKGALIRELGKVVTLWLFFFGPALTVPLIMLHKVLLDRRLRLLWIATAVASIGIIAPAWFNAHYAAPLTGVFYVAILQGLRHLRWCRLGKRCTGLLLAQAVPLICLVMVPLRVLAKPLHISMATDWRLTWTHATPGLYGRDAMEKQLSSLPGQQLVIVRYKPNHDYHTEWVYNEANIDAAKVVWAREMDTAHNQQLLNYFQGRTAWLLEADENPPRLSAYPR